MEVDGAPGMASHLGDGRKRTSVDEGTPAIEKVGNSPVVHILARPK